MNEQFGLALVVGLGLLGGIGYGIKAFLDRRGLKARAGSDDATAASIVAAAARELIDPLRQELATERAENSAEMARLKRQHAEDLADERAKVERVRVELDEALKDVRRLRNEVTVALLEVQQYKSMSAAKEEQVRALTEENALLRAQLGQGDPA